MSKVNVAEFFNTSIEEEAIEVGHLLAEPNRDHLSVDSVFRNGGMSSGSTTQGRDEDLRFEVFEEMWPEIDEVEDFHETNGASTACENYLLDAECIEKAPGSDFTPCGLSSSENSSVESPSELGGTDNGDVGTSEMSAVSVPVHRSRNGAFDNVNVYQTRARNRIKFHSSNSLNTKHHKENDMGNTRGVKGKQSVGIMVKTKNFFDASGDGNLDTQKRLCKPTKRFIDEVSDRRSKKLKGKQKCTTSLKDKYVSKGRASTSGEESEDESYTDKFDDDYETTIGPRNEDDRRKIPRMWALSEVVKLVDGISHHGVGRWTEIKRLLFPTSDYRTPIDLRDKWRNLLRASNSWLQSKGGDEQKLAPQSRPLPRAVLHRVSELASIYPYPKAGKSMQKRSPRVGKRGHRR